jgi:hypothetical protein
MHYERRSLAPADAAEVLAGRVAHMAREVALQKQKVTETEAKLNQALEGFRAIARSCVDHRASRDALRQAVRDCVNRARIELSQLEDGDEAG